MKRPILIHPDPRLKKVCAPVADLTDELRQLADDMLETMYDAPGIGLAAPQVGVLDRLIVLDCVKEEGAAPRPLVMFNPEVMASSDDTNVYEEGCLSIPEQYADVDPPRRGRGQLDRPRRQAADRELRRAVGDLRAARDRPSEWQAVHRLPEAAEAADDHPQDAEAQARAWRGDERPADPDLARSAAGRGLCDPVA